MTTELRPRLVEENRDPFSHGISNSPSPSDSDESIILNLPLTTPASIPATRSLLDLPAARVHIVEAGASSEGTANPLKKYVVYTIRLFADTLPGKDTLTRRRYSDFVSLHALLIRIFPLIVVPPIPPKHYNSPLFGGLTGSTNSTTTPTPGHSAPPSRTSDAKLINHRKRLLSSFLLTCLDIPKIRSLDLFANFLAPNSSWPDEIRLAKRKLPKSIYSLNPENGLRTDPVYSHFPQPVSSHTMSFLNNRIISRTTTRLLSGPPENPAREPSPELKIKTASIDEVSNRILRTLIGLSADYCELGSIFNAFSLVMVDTDSPQLASSTVPQSSASIAVILRSMGQVFDRTYITLNSLIDDLEIEFCEPLGVAVRESEGFQAVTKFYAKKRRQKTLVEQELGDKKKELASLQRPDPVASRPSDRQPETTQHSRLGFLTLRSLKRISRYVTDIIDLNPTESRAQKVAALESRVATLEECSKIVLEDIAYISDEIHKNAIVFEKKQLRLINKVLRCYYAHLIAWARSNVDIWEEVKEEIMKL